MAGDLAGTAADVRLLDLDPAADNGYDLSDFLAASTSSSDREEARRILERCAELTPKVSLEGASRTGTHPENPASPIPVLGGVSTTCVPASRRK